MSQQSPKRRKKVLVSGCFDLLHSGHIKFFEEASKLGDVYVCLGTDENIQSLKHHKTMYPNDERLYMVQAIKYVHHCQFSSGSGDIDFEPDLDDIRPDIFYVNEDGDRQAKRKVIAKRPWIQYVVAQRTAKKGLNIRSSTQLKLDINNKSKINSNSNNINLNLTEFQKTIVSQLKDIKQDIANLDVDECKMAQDANERWPCMANLCCGWMVGSTVGFFSLMHNIWIVFSFV